MEKRTIHIVLAIVTAIIFLAAFKGMSGAVDEDIGIGEQPTIVPDDEELEATCEDIPIVFTDGSGGTMPIPVAGANVLETHVKHHFEMPENMTKVTVTFTWDPTWELELSIGTGDCPHSGEELASEISSAGEATITFEDENGLTTGAWFAHLGDTNPGSHRGESCDYQVVGELCSCTGEPEGSGGGSGGGNNGVNGL
ncbi:MAG: hypothetical protein KAT70_00215 [Thermoplasmata archaeon]|nr:hypothetical protein [Thermoplasmata archaeon]